MARIVTDVGASIIAQRIKGLETEPLYIAWGTGTTVPVAGDIALKTEDASYGYSRVAGVSVIVTLGANLDTYQVSGSITATANLTISEWGLFDALTVGNMLLREVTATPFILSIGQTINFVFKVQIARC